MRNTLLKWQLWIQNKTIKKETSNTCDWIIPRVQLLPHLAHVLMGSMAFHIIRERKVALRKSYTCRGGARADLSRTLPIRMHNPKH